MIAFLGPGPPPNSIHNIPFGLLLSLMLSVLAVIAVAALSLRHTEHAGRLGLGVLGSGLGIVITCLPFIVQLFITASLTSGVPDWLPDWWPWPKPATALFFGTVVGFYSGYQFARLWNILGTEKAPTTQMPVNSSRLTSTDTVDSQSV